MSRKGRVCRSFGCLWSGYGPLGMRLVCWSGMLEQVLGQRSSCGGELVAFMVRLGRRSMGSLAWCGAVACAGEVRGVWTASHLLASKRIEHVGFLKAPLVFLMHANTCTHVTLILFFSFHSFHFFYLKNSFKIKNDTINTKLKIKTWYLAWNKKTKHNYLTRHLNTNNLQSFEQKFEQYSNMRQN